MLRAVQRYWAAGTMEKVAVVSLAVSAVVFMCVGTLSVISALLNGSPSLGAFTQAIHTAAPQHTATVRPAATTPVVHFPPTT
jgi:hypothetical protein